MKAAFAGALAASAILHAGALLAPAPRLGAASAAPAGENREIRLSVRLQALPDLKLASAPQAARPLTDAGPARSVAPEAALPLPAPPVFYGSRELDQLALPVGGLPDLAMLVTDPAREWRLRVRVFVDVQGRVAKVELVDQLTSTDDLDEAVAAILKTVPFNPAMKDGQAVASQKLMDLVVGGER